MLSTVDAGVRDGVDGSGINGTSRTSGRKYLHTVVVVGRQFQRHPSLRPTHRQTASPPKQTPHHAATTHQLATELSPRHLTTCPAVRRNRISRANTTRRRTRGTGRDAMTVSVPEVSAVAVMGVAIVVGCAVGSILPALR